MANVTKPKVGRPRGGKYPAKITVRISQAAADGIAALAEAYRVDVKQVVRWWADDAAGGKWRPALPAPDEPQKRSRKG